MLKHTETIIRATLAADDTITKEQADTALRVLHGKADPEPVGRILKTTEAARLCSVTTKTLRTWTKAGLLVPVYGSGTKQRIGYTEASVKTMVEGRARVADARPAIRAEEGGAA